jgi:YHS domain-containing protein
VLLFAAAREGQRDSTGLPIDPVCRMAVDPEHSAGQLSYEGVEYQFCSLECAGAFAADPERYSSRPA